MTSFILQRVAASGLITTGVPVELANEVHAYQACLDALFVRLLDFFALKSHVIKLFFCFQMNISDVLSQLQMLDLDTNTLCKMALDFPNQRDIAETILRKMYHRTGSEKNKFTAKHGVLESTMHILTRFHMDKKIAESALFLLWGISDFGTRCRRVQQQLSYSNLFMDVVHMAARALLHDEGKAAWVASAMGSISGNLECITVDHSNQVVRTILDIMKIHRRSVEVARCSAIGLQSALRHPIVSDSTVYFDGIHVIIDAIRMFTDPFTVQMLFELLSMLERPKENNNRFIRYKRSRLC